MLDLVDAVRNHAMANYGKDGWDYVVECYEDSDIIEILSDADASTPKQAIKAVGDYVGGVADYRDEIQAEAF